MIALCGVIIGALIAVCLMFPSLSWLVILSAVVGALWVCISGQGEQEEEHILNYGKGGKR